MGMLDKLKKLVEEGTAPTRPSDEGWTPDPQSEK